MEFGVPSKKKVKTEKYPETPVITLLPYEGGSTSRKIEFNKKAYEVMNLETDDINYVAFSFDRSDYTNNFIVNANEFGESSASLRLSKNGKISNKSHYEEIKNRYGTDMESELELTIVDSGREHSGFKVFNLVTLESYLETQESIKDSEISEDKVTSEEKEIEEEVNA